MGMFAAVNSEVAASAPLVARRAAYLATNDPLLSNGVGNLTSYLVGTGARPVVRIDDRDQRRAVGRRFDEWAEVADHAGRTDFYGLQAVLARDLIVHGEALALLHDDDEGLRLQVLPPDHLDHARTGQLVSGGFIANGVEHDVRGRRVAYHIHPEAPSSIMATGAATLRIPAADVVHIIHPIGPGQVRGLSWLAPAIVPASDLSQLHDALLMGAKIAAMHAAFITDPSDVGELEWSEDIGWEPGAVSRLPAGTDVKFSAPDQMKDAPGFVRHNVKVLAAALGVPTHLLDGDLTAANYSSLRAGLLPFLARMEAVQYATLAPQLLRPVWRRWLALEIASGGLDLPADTRADWLFPRPAQVDPLKDLEAQEKALELRLKSRTQVIAEQGWNADDVDVEIAADRAREADLGLTADSGEAPDAV